MTPAQEILNLIETVDPSDTAKLDEIDRAVRLYIDPAQDAYEKEFLYDLKKYTRSRDALKSIRPGEWTFQIQNASYGFDVFYYPPMFGLVEGPSPMRSFALPTEELAELHAIIQAIEYEMNQ